MGAASHHAIHNLCVRDRYFLQSLDSSHGLFGINKWHLSDISKGSVWSCVHDGVAGGFMRE